MILSYIRSFINIVVYLLIKDKSKINADIERYLESYGITPSYGKNCYIKELVYCSKRSREFLNVFYFRMGRHLSRYHLLSFLKTIYPPKETIGFGIAEQDLGKGLFIQHGDSTIIHAHKVGDNLTVYQNVTIGDSGKGYPTIGDNVTFCTGAIVLGPICIGDGAIIGANATIVKDVPANSVIVPAKNRIIKLNANPVNLTF